MPDIKKSKTADKPKAKARKPLPLSGSEHEFRHPEWTKYKVANNCYAYAFHDMRKWRPHKSVPGNQGTGSMVGHTYTHCKGIARKILEDNPGKVKLAKPTTKCKPGFYKVMMVVAPKDRNGNPGGDFHFYKQHGIVNYRVRKGDTLANLAKFFKVPVGRLGKAGDFKVGKVLRFMCNCFSHKMGWATGPLLVGSDGALITDPRYTGRKYGLNYSKYCNSFCVSNKGIKVGPKLTNSFNPLA